MSNADWQLSRVRVRVARLHGLAAKRREGQVPHLVHVVGPIRDVGVSMRHFTRAAVAGTHSRPTSE